jgi:NitT/TauT family transport system permease protein
MKKNIILVNILFILLFISILLPGTIEIKSEKVFIMVVLLIKTVFIYKYYKYKAQSTADIVSLIFATLLLWEIVTKHLYLVNPVLLPPPGNVFNVFYTHGRMMIDGFFSSMVILIIGFTVSLIFGVGLGLIIGWIPRLCEMFYPIVKVLAPIPAIIYTPYIVAIMPTFRSASAMIMILGLFFPTLMQVIARVHSMDYRIINTARTMNVSNFTMVFQILLPYMIPGVISNLHISLSTSFMILTIAEMMGATSGLGYFIKNYADFGNYSSVIAGIILVGIVVTALNSLITLIENKIIKWKIV